MDSAAFADKDFKMLAEEFHSESEEPAGEPPAAEEASPAEPEPKDTQEITGPASDENNGENEA